MRRIIILVFVFVIVGKCSCMSLLEFLVGAKVGTDPKESGKSYEERLVDQMMAQSGYPLETHEVATEDGYIVTLHRIPYGRKKKSTKDRLPVVIANGLFATTEIWIMRPKSSFAYLLANAGYDVWMLNFRGTYYSRKHKQLDSNKNATYWNFSIDELGYYDVAASIDYVLNKTKQDKIYLAGYSMGSCASLILLSQRPEYNHKVRFFINFAPLAYSKRGLHSFLTTPMLLLPYIAEVLVNENILEIFPRRQYFTDILEILCKEDPMRKEACLNLFYSAVGADPTFNYTVLLEIFKIYPSGTSLNVLLHHHQIFTTGKLQPFQTKNYKTLQMQLNRLAPEYNVSSVSVPAAIYYADSDTIITKEDVGVLATKLPNVVGVFRVPYSGYNHIDFVAGQGVKQMLYDKIITLMGKYR